MSALRAGKDLQDRCVSRPSRAWAILGCCVASLLPALAVAHSEGTEASDPSSAAAVLSFAAATTQYTAPASGLKPWRLPANVRPVPAAPMNHADHAAHAGHSGQASAAGQIDHSQHASQMDHSQHAEHATPVEIEVRKPAADAHQGH